MKNQLEIYTIFILIFFSSALIAAGKNSEREIQEESVIKYMSGKDSVESYLAVPEGNGPFPALIIIHEWWGITDWIKENVQRFADSGYIAIAVDLYRGKSTKDAGEAHELSRGLPEDRAIRDLKAAYNQLQEMANVHKDKIGVIGWCMGGGYSLQTAINIPGINAAVICYGRLVTDEALIEKINCPVLGIFGNEDRGISEESVKEFEAALNETGVKNNIIIYPGAGHAFMNPGNEKGYNEEKADKAWKEIYSFLNENFK